MSYADLLHTTAKIEPLTPCDRNLHPSEVFAMMEAFAISLTAAGMVERYRSKYGHSIYMGWPGKSGVLRVSNHRQKAIPRDSAPIWARITLNAESLRWSEGARERHLALAIGQYFIKAGAADGNA